MRNPIAVQALVLNKRIPAVLLGRWRKGPLKNRFTGMLGAANPKEPPHNEAVRIATSLVPQLSLMQPERLEPRAIFEFQEVLSSGQDREGIGSTEKTTELQYLYQLHDDEVEAVMGIDSSNSRESMLEPQWFPLVDIPYNEMPADDRLWYPQALDPKGPYLSGSFKFRGTKLLHHDIIEIQATSLATLFRAALDPQLSTGEDVSVPSIWRSKEGFSTE